MELSIGLLKPTSISKRSGEDDHYHQRGILPILHRTMTYLLNPRAERLEFFSCRPFINGRRKEKNNPENSVNPVKIKVFLSVESACHLLVTCVPK
jgi:hypothetical protein